MKRQSFPAIASSSIRPVIVAALAIAIFVGDTLTDLEIAVAVFYVAVVLLSVSFFRKRGVVLVSIGCMTLTLLSYFLTRSGAATSGLVNCIISISAIGATTYLALKFESAQIAMHEARAQLEHVARVTTLGELTASIAHEVNQPLAAVISSGSACLHWLASEPPNLERAKQAVERIVKDANRASMVIGRIRGLAKRAPPHKEQLNINEMILETLALTRSEIEQHHIALRAQLKPGLPSVLGDRVQLQQVILNLVINGMEAISVTDQGPRELRVSSAADDAASVCVEVRDTGIGLDTAALDQLFTAFYTTKSDGMGMGLTISRSIIEGHGGQIEAKPNAPRGAVFAFTLPVDREPL
jgi:C4-dicarboxylate-specific signal transduction histidine kinase